MAPSPALLNPSLELPRATQKAWLAVFFSLAFICFTSSTLMSGYHTQFVVNDVWKALFGNWHDDLCGVVNGDGRMIGHFCGYGAVGVRFRSAWQHAQRTRAVHHERHLWN